MISFDQSWNRLVALARRVFADDAAPVSPPGFSTRVVAHWMAVRQQAATAMWELLAVRGLGVALAVSIIAVVFIWPLINGTSVGGDDLAALADPLEVAGLVP